ncbi:MAG: hypothetical protein JWO09_3405 [Bacteroidetes bacterium]|nr:hypothetical protein [Bacteroidota bacterium]
MAVLTVIALTGVACGQNAKVKTITIINGDTTVSEKEAGDADIEKQITMVINHDGDSAGKKVVKKIIINGDGQKDGDALAYAYTINDGKDEDEPEKASMKLNIRVTGNMAKVEAESSSKEQLNISILDENGKQVFYDSQKSGGKYSKEIKLEKGTYFLNLVQDKKSTTDKIVIR